MDEILINSYLGTTYTTLNPRFQLVIGKKNGELDAYLKEINQSFWAFITAENPRSKSFSKEVNLKRNNTLESYLIKRNIPYLKGIGIPKDSDWIPENSFLIFGLNREEAQKIAVKYEQNAFVYGELARIPELVYGYLDQ